MLVLGACPRDCPPVGSPPILIIGKGCLRNSRAVVYSSALAKNKPINIAPPVTHLSGSLHVVWTRARLLRLFHIKHTPRMTYTCASIAEYQDRLHLICNVRVLFITCQASFNLNLSPNHAYALCGSKILFLYEM